MKLFRFMSREEFEKFRKGKVLINNTRHRAKTDSLGFCFLDFEEYKPEQALHFLSNIVSFDICAVFEAKQIDLKKSYGVYADHKTLEANKQLRVINPYTFKPTMEVKEYCTTQYSNKDFKLLKYSENIWQQWNLLEFQDELVWKEI